MEKVTCPRCSGTGITPFTHVQRGVCFLCGGSGKAYPTRPRKTTFVPISPVDRRIECSASIKTIADWINTMRAQGWSDDRMMEAYGSDIEDGLTYIACRSERCHGDPRFNALLERLFANIPHRLHAKFRRLLASNPCGDRDY